MERTRIERIVENLRAGIKGYQRYDFRTMNESTTVTAIPTEMYEHYKQLVEALPEDPGFWATMQKVIELRKSCHSYAAILDVLKHCNLE